MSSGQGGESPPPETQTGAQLQDPPGSGAGGVQGFDNTEEREKSLKAQLDNLESNPKGVLDDHVTAKFAKDTKMGD